MRTKLLIDGDLVAGGAGAFRRDAALRAHCLRQLREALNDEIETLREITIAEVGPSRSLTYRGQLQTPVDDLEFPAATAENYPWQVDLGVAAPMGIASARTLVREPFGVVGAITPWNFPHQVTLAKLGPALAAGNTVVLKPAPDTPWCAAEVGRIIAERTDFPAGVVNIVTASDHRIGTRLAEDARVDAVYFTGSTVAMHAGQGCALTTRLLVPRERYSEALDAVAAAMSRIAEIFGPVLVVLAHDGENDAVRLANDSPYGLSGTVFGSDDRAASVASRLRVGTVNVNGGMWYSADVPFGGYKQSGIGREMGLAGFEEYLETKVVATAVQGTGR